MFGDGINFKNIVNDAHNHNDKASHHHSPHFRRDGLETPGQSRKLLCNEHGSQESGEHGSTTKSWLGLGVYVTVADRGDAAATHHNRADDTRAKIGDCACHKKDETELAQRNACSTRPH